MKKTKGIYLALLTMLAPLAASAGPISALYMTEFFGTNGSIVQGNSQIGSFATGVSTETGIAVIDTIRIVNGLPATGPGSEYDLNGNVVNSGIYTNPGFQSLYDGTTDGTYNYSIAHNDGNIGFQNVIRFDLNWQNPQVLFSMNQRGSGITYDANTNTLWTTCGPVAPTGDIQQYSLTGQLLSSFANPAGGRLYALAWDPADGTLWTSAFDSTALLQFSVTGNLLQTANIPGLSCGSSCFGMEFRYESQAVPEPGTLALLGLGLVSMAARRRKKV